MFYYSLNMNDVSSSLSGQVGFFNKESKNKSLQKLLTEAYNLSDQIVYMGTIGYVFPRNTCFPQE